MTGTEPPTGSGTSPSSSSTQLHVTTGIGGAIGASSAFALTTFGILPASIPSVLIEAAGAAAGASIAHLIDTAITSDAIIAALKEVKVLGGTAAVYYLLGMLPLQNIGGFAFQTAAVPLKGFGAGLLSSWYVFPTS